MSLCVRHLWFLFYLIETYLLSWDAVMSFQRINYFVNWRLSVKRKSQIKMLLSPLKFKSEVPKKKFQKPLTHDWTTNHCMFSLLFSTGRLRHWHAASALTVCLLASGAGAGEASQEEAGAQGLLPHAGSGEIKGGNVTISRALCNRSAAHRILYVFLT